jgi:hypothetical protein
MPWWVTALGVTGPLLWAFYLLWRVEVWKRRRDEQAGARLRVENDLEKERQLTAELRLQLGAKDSAMAIVQKDLAELEEDYAALAAKVPGSIRNRLRDQLRRAQGSGSDGPSDS